MSIHEKLSEVQLLRSRATFHALPLFICERKFKPRTHVKLRDTGNQPLRTLSVLFNAHRITHPAGTKSREGVYKGNYLRLKYLVSIPVKNLDSFE